MKGGEYEINMITIPIKIKFCEDHAIYTNIFQWIFLTIYDVNGPILLLCYTSI